jgi:hypothetical protein
MAAIRPIKEIVINGTVVNNRTKNDTLPFSENEWAIEGFVWFQYKSGCYPVGLIELLKKHNYFDKVKDLKIKISKHKGIQKELKKNPQWFYLENETNYIKIKNI